MDRERDALSTAMSRLGVEQNKYQTIIDSESATVKEISPKKRGRPRKEQKKAGGAADDDDAKEEAGADYDDDDDDDDEEDATISTIFSGLEFCSDFFEEKSFEEKSFEEDDLDPPPSDMGGGSSSSVGCRV
jgi:hypothetical protein